VSTPASLGDDRDDEAVSDDIFRCAEAIHAVVYFTPGVSERFAALGLRGFWMGYVASRSAALGTPGPDLVTALFFGFARRRIARALPDAWSFATPEAVLATRFDIAGDVLRPCLGAQFSELGAVLHEVVVGGDFAGRPLAAAHAALPWPDDPVLAVWHGATVLREYRGDVHVAACVLAGLDGVTANLSHQGTGRLPSNQQDYRGWTDDEWSAGRARLATMGWLDPCDGSLTATGRAGRLELERATTRGSAPMLDRLGPDGLAALHTRLSAAARAVVACGVVPYPNPTGVPAPSPAP
jgi:hypothetical protein